MKKNTVIFLLIILLVAMVAYQKFYLPQRDLDRLEINEIESAKSVNKAADKERSTENRMKDSDELYLSRTNLITKAVEKIKPAVVSVNVIKTKMVRRPIFFGFYDEVPYDVKSIGSGVIFTEDGYLLTNAHVVEGATEIKVILTDNSQYDGKLIGVDSLHDIAIVKIEGQNLPSAKLGVSSDLIIGEWAIAVGNPYGFLIKDSQPSVSVGVISAFNRDFAENKDGKVYRRMIQTDAAINPGNSGGPLVNIHGQVIGLNTFIFSESGGSVGIGFAIPIDRVKKMAQELIQYGKVRKIWLDFGVQDLNPMLANYYKLENLDGILVTSIDKKSPAGKAGLKKGDVITMINSNKIKSIEDAQLAVTDIAVGEKFKLTVLRNGKEGVIEIEAQEFNSN